MKTKFVIGLSLMFIVVAAVFAVRAEDVDVIEDSKELFRQIQLFSDSITLISTDYVEPIKVKDLMYGAIKGMMNTLDGYSQFLDPESFKEITEETKGEFGGLGVTIGIRDGVLTVIAPMEDTPAFKAGLQSGDKIVKIDDEITRDITLDEAVKRMRGDPGTKVSITVVREGVDKLLDFTITRAIIKVKSIKEARIVEDDIGYVKLVEFQARTARDLKKTIKKLQKDGAGSLILDVRNNPGGLFDASIEVADLFLEPGTLMVYTEGRDPKKRMEFRAKKKSDFDGLDLIVLVNNGSASASEILAGAIQDNKRGIVVGVTTFGKGSVQTVIPLEDKSALRLTTASYFTPAGKNLRDKGIEPDIYAEKKELAKKKKVNDEPDLFEKLEKKDSKPVEKEKKKAEAPREEYDNQLKQAINILKSLRIFETYKSSHLTGVPAGAQKDTTETEVL